MIEEEAPPESVTPRAEGAAEEEGDGDGGEDGAGNLTRDILIFVRDRNDTTNETPTISINKLTQTKTYFQL